MTTITRRTALAVPVTLPLLPVSAYAAPADPAVEAYRVWRAAFIAYEQSLERPDIPEGCPIVVAAERAEWDNMVRLASIVATTPAGIAGQLRVGLGLFGCALDAGSDLGNPADYQFGNCRDDMDGRLYRNMLAGAERMAGVTS